MSGLSPHPARQKLPVCNLPKNNTTIRAEADLAAVRPSAIPPLPPFPFRHPVTPDFAQLRRG